MKYIVVLDKERAKRFECIANWAAISVSSKPDTFPELHTIRRKGLLQLCFDDVSFPHAIPKNLKLFNVDLAQQIIDFVNLHKDNIETLLIHCEAGLSRSPAIAAAISERFGLGSADFYFEKYMPNVLVYKILSELKK